MYCLFIVSLPPFEHFRYATDENSTRRVATTNAVYTHTIDKIGFVPSAREITNESERFLAIKSPVNKSFSRHCNRHRV